VKRYSFDRQVPRNPRPLERGQGAQHKMKLPFREAPPFRAGSFTIDTLKRDALGCYEAG